MAEYLVVRQLKFEVFGRHYPQMLRRSFSTMALDSGASPKDVQGQMRHTDARMSLY
jgi:hypothetical protein